MARTPDLNNVIRTLVAESVEEALAPYKDVLERLGSLVGGVRRRGPGRPPKGTRPASYKPATDRGDASKFSVGQSVSYKQGRGLFDAKVIKIDTDNNTLTIERLKDKKRVERPASKVMAA